MFGIKFRVNMKSVLQCIKSLWRGKRNFSDKLSSEFLTTMKEVFQPIKRPKLPPSKFGGTHIVTLITDSEPGSLKCVNYLENIFKAARAPVSLEHIVSNAEPESTTEAISAVARNGTGIKIGLGNDNKTKREQFVIHKALNVFACVVHIHSFAGFKCRFPNLNLLVIMQNISEDYSILEYEPKKGVVKSLRHSEDNDTIRYLCFVFNIARAEQRKKITFVHKTNELPLIDGRFISIAKSVGELYPEIKIEFVPINKVVRNLLLHPNKYDCLCSSERYGTTLATISSVVAGGPPLFSAIEHGDNYAMFKPLHTRLSLAESNTVSSYGLLSCCVHLMRYLGLRHPAFKIWNEFCNVLKEEYRTEEYGGSCSDEDIINRVVNQLNEYTDVPKDLVIYNADNFEK